jgi:hypothetical protein
MSDRSTVINAMAVTGLSVTGAQLARGRFPTIRPAVGLAITTAILLAGIEGNPNTARLSRQFAILIATTAVLTSGAIAGAALARYLATPPTTR